MNALLRAVGYFLLTFVILIFMAQTCTRANADGDSHHHQPYIYPYAPQYYPYSYNNPYPYVTEWDVLQVMELAEGIGKEMAEAEMDAQEQFECEKLNRIAAHGESLWAERDEETAATFRALRKDCNNYD